MDSVLLAEEEPDPPVHVHHRDPAAGRLLLLLFFRDICLHIKTAQFFIQFLQFFVRHSAPIIGNPDVEPFLTRTDPDHKMTFSDLSLDPVVDGIFHDRLQSQLGKLAHKRFLFILTVIADPQIQLAAKTKLLDIIIIFHICQFFFQCDQVIYLGNGIAEVSCQCLRHLRNRIHPCDQRLCPDAFQSIIKKMGIDLIL